jgi:desulfoferrodoxin-like iron-binding protein
MPISADVYKCKVCESGIKIINGSEVPPSCCETEMERLTEKEELKKIPDDKNVCGAVFKCQKCNFKARVINDQGTVPSHCMLEMKFTADKTSGERDQIYKCTNCGQIIKITSEGCGPLRCCDSEICVMDVPQIVDLEKKIQIEIDKIHDKPMDDPYFVCSDCEREIKIVKMGEGKLICHGKDMNPRSKIGYYFQGGGQA